MGRPIQYWGYDATVVGVAANIHGGVLCLEDRAGAVEHPNQDSQDGVRVLIRQVELHGLGCWRHLVSSIWSEFCPIPTQAVQLP